MAVLRYPFPEAAKAAGPLLRNALPDAATLRGLRALWIADLPLSEAEALAAAARNAGVLVNVEDVPHLCDFHNLASVRRGDLLVTVSTGGRNPGLAALIRRRLESLFSDEWADRIEILSRKRRAWRAQGGGMQAVARLTETAVASSKGWLP